MNHLRKFLPSHDGQEVELVQQIKECPLGPPDGPPRDLTKWFRRETVDSNLCNQRRSNRLSATFGGPIRFERPGLGQVGQLGYISES